MARYIAGWSNVTAAAVADSSVHGAGNFPGVMRGGTSTMSWKVNEVYIGGEDTASTPTTMILARTVTTVSSGAQTVGTYAAADPNLTAPGTLVGWGNTMTVYPQRAPTLYLLNLSLNTFGGIARWQARYGEEIAAYGNVVGNGELVLSSKVGTGKTSGHIIHELV